MPTIAENLQTLIDQKAAIKAALESQGKEPTEALGSYAGLIDTLENPEKVVYCVTVDGEDKKFAQLYGEQKVDLTATANDIRIGTTAITDAGYLEGTKVIPAYYVGYGKKIVLADNDVTITNPQYDYKELMITIAPYDTSVNESVSVEYVSIEDSMYEAKSATKISDISKDLINGQVNLGITATEKSVVRYFITREEG